MTDTPRTIKIFNLPNNINEDKVKDICSPYGIIENVFFVNEIGENKGKICYVIFNQNKSANNALKLNNTLYYGNNIEVESINGARYTFNLQQYLTSNEGNDWLKKVTVKDSNNKSFRYYAPSVCWEDINRHNNSSYGDFIFDVTINMQSSLQKHINNSIRYALRPQNMTDPIAPQSTAKINIPIGNYNGNKLHNIKLIDLLSDENLLKQVGLNCKISGSLYEPLIDEPAHCLPDIQCICGQSLIKTTVKKSYPNINAYCIQCDVCKNKLERNIIFHCPDYKHGEDHYDICETCVGLQIRNFIETDNDNDINMYDIN
eukprot:292397_1